MARKRLVTRTIESTVATCDIVLKNEQKFDKKEIILSGTFNDESALKNAVAKQMNENEVLLGISSAEVKTNRYGMLESDFIKLANIIDDKENEENA